MNYLTPFGQLKEAYHVYRNVFCGGETGTAHWQMKAFIYLFLPYMLTAIARICCKLLIYQCLIECAIRKLFAPLAVADIYKEGIRSSGTRFLKRIFGCWVKLMIAAMSCSVTAIVFNYLINTITGGSGEVTLAQIGSILLELCVLGFTCVGGIFKGGQLADEIVGA